MKKIAIILTIAFSAILGGCASSGNLKSPLTPVGSTINSDKEVATVYFYRSTDHFGMLVFDDLYVLIDKEFKFGIASDETDTGSMMLTNRSSHMLKKLKPGVHEFYIGGVFSKAIASLEAGKTYYLAVSFHPGGISGLQFRTRSDFVEATKKSRLVEWSGKCNFVSGCSTKIVNE